jgi:hypothetical protein
MQCVNILLDNNTKGGMMFKYNIGTVVMYNTPGVRLIKSTLRPVYGHVTGFSRVEYDNDRFETVLLVRWDTGEEYPIHPGNVIVREDPK